MSDREDREHAVLDLYVRTQLAKAAETYVSRVGDTEWRLKAILTARTQGEQSRAAAADS